MLILLAFDGVNIRENLMIGRFVLTHTLDCVQQN